MKPNERASLREFNKSPFIKYPVKENITTTSHKISLIIQVQLGGVEHPNTKDFNLIRRQFVMESNAVFERIQRLSRCLADCKLANCDAVALKHCLDLIRSLSAGYWEYSSLQLRQIPYIGPAAVRKLTSNNIHSVKQLASYDTAGIERVMSKNPPYGKNMRDVLAKFPRLNITVNLERNTVAKSGGFPKVTVRAKLSFENEAVPVWAGRVPSVTFMAESSAGDLAHFWRGNIKSLQKCHELVFSVEMKRPEDEIRCHLACDDIVGTSCSSTLKPDLPASAFPVRQALKVQSKLPFGKEKGSLVVERDEFGIDSIEDDELIEAMKEVERPSSDYGSVDDLDGFEDIDAVDEEKHPSMSQSIESIAESVRMDNGRWSCNHACSGGQATKNGRECKHKCCHEGLDKPRKISARKVSLCPSVSQGGFADHSLSPLEQKKESRLRVYTWFVSSKRVLVDVAL